MEVQVYNINCLYTQFNNLVLSMCQSFKILAFFALVSPSDYEALSEVLTFAPCDTQHCVNVSITDDLVNELEEETFSLTLNKISSFVILSTTAGEVLITDDDGKEFKAKDIV